MSTASSRGKLILNFEVTPEQKHQIEENAAWFGLTLAAYLRHAALGGTVERPTMRERNARMKERFA